MTIRILRLTLEQFKGVSQAVYHFEGRDAVLFGRNGTGKSSVCDAWCWLMTGKDSQGRAPADSGGFAIKPLDASGNVADRAARTVVEAVLAVARSMPFEYHTIPGKPFDIRKSEALDWLLEQPEIRSYVWDRIVQSGHIHFDRESKTWVGADYDD